MLDCIGFVRGFPAPAALGRVIVADGDDSSYVAARQAAAPDLWQVRHVSDAEALRRELRSARPQVAAVNLALVDDGLREELTERARRGLRVIVLADEHSFENERRARLLGPVAYLPKPVCLPLLCLVLAAAVSDCAAAPGGGRTW